MSEHAVAEHEQNRDANAERAEYYSYIYFAVVAFYKQDDKSGRVDYRRAEHCLTTARRPHGGEKESRIYREDETALVFSCKIQRRRQAYEKHHTHSVPHTPAESQLFSVEISVYEQLFARQIL